jgi:integrase
MPDFLHALLRNRARNVTSQCVFPELADSKHGADLRHWSEKVTQASGVPFTPHDLRRTFITAAESLDISVYALKRLLNHRINPSDVTAGYIITEVERLRQPMQKINERLIHLVNRQPTANVVEIEKS